MKTILLAVVAAAVLLAAPPRSMAADSGGSETGKPYQDPVKQEQVQCLSCHSAAGLAAATATTDPAARVKLAGLQVDPARYGRSVHADVACEFCHTNIDKSGVPIRSAGEVLLPRSAVPCVECHRSQGTAIVPEFARSVHAKANPQAFGCYSCHDPHYVRKAASFDSGRQLARRDNALCLDCHDSDEKYAKLTTKPRPDLLQAHGWQPSPSLHLAAVRCVDCHTAEKPGGVASHDILPKQQAIRDCGQCHSPQSSLLGRLYHRELGDGDGRSSGFLKPYLASDLYVVGLTRSRDLDRGGLALFVVLLAGLAAHGLLRYAGHRVRKGKK